LRLDVEVALRPANEGGRSISVQSGYRPLCRFRRYGGDEVTVGMCELEVERPIRPGETVRGTFAFDEGVSQTVRSLVHVGTEFDLAEGAQIVGRARVLAIDRSGT
jgi:translation elongation factor EF-Tu-like GTPase